MEEELLKEIIEKLDTIIAILRPSYVIRANPEIYYPRNDDPPQLWLQPEPSTTP